MLEIIFKNSAGKIIYLIETNYTLFGKFRKEVCSAYDPEFGKLYSAYYEARGETQFEIAKNALAEYFGSHEIPQSDLGLLDFLFSSDISGETVPEVCSRIYDVIKNVDFAGKECMYRFYDDQGAQKREDGYEAMKKLLKECADNKYLMTWM